MVLFLNTDAQGNGKRFGFELNSGVSVATQKLGGAELNTGFGFEAMFHYRFMPHAGVYAGWGWNHFASDNSFAGNDVGFEETGYMVGLEFKHPVGNSKLSYYLRAGGLYNHIEVENKDGDIIHDTKHGLGWQVAAGIDVPLGKNWSLTPGVKFNSLRRDLNDAGAIIPLKQDYVSARIGLLKRF